MRFTSEQDTYNWALEFAKELKVGDKVALYGNLGAGKTVISRGICKGLGFEGTVCSPTYTILHEYPNNPPIFHFDLYRLEGGADLYEVGMDPDYLESGISLIEWPERLEGNDAGGRGGRAGWERKARLRCGRSCGMWCDCELRRRGRAWRG